MVDDSESADVLGSAAAVVGELAKAGGSLSRSQMRMVDKVCEVSKVFMEANVQRFLPEAAGRSVLRCSSNDGTLVKTKRRMASDTKDAVKMEPGSVAASAPVCGKKAFVFGKEGTECSSAIGGTCQQARHLERQSCCGTPFLSRMGSPAP